MSFLKTYTLDGMAYFHDSGGDYDDADYCDLVDDTTDQRLEDIIKRHHGERLVITIQVLGPPCTRQDHLRRCAGELNSQMYIDIWLGRWQQHLEYQQDVKVRDTAIRAKYGISN